MSDSAEVSLSNGTDVDLQLMSAVDEISDRVQLGKSVDIEGYVKKFPDRAAYLRQLVQTLEGLGDLGKTAAPGAAGGVQSQTRQIGDFRIVRELGRGGMGAVFEAEQISMGRRVALKVLPFAALARDKSLQRFRNEVRAAAALDSPHIVSVYSVGEERGIHYFSMQLVRGQTMADLIWQTRTDLSSPAPSKFSDDATGAGPDSLGNADPTASSSISHPPSTQRDEQARISTAVDSRHDTERYRTAARLGVQAAEALQHAHDQGVLHRDIKPGNLMLDANGQLYITDFGLARIEADAGVTLTGDIVGTLRYMAPEQALAKRVVIDHRADIYSLGATLYELLTLKPAFDGEDRSDLLKQIAFAEPVRLRKVDRHIPADLETIILKAMAKNPDERYQTAQQFADDLQSFLEYRPIQAKRPTLLSRVSKLSKRHVGIVRTAVAGLLLSLAILLCTTIVVAQLYGVADARRRSAEEEKALANRERGRAELLLGKMQFQRGVELLGNNHPLGLLDLVDARITVGDHPLGQAAARLWAAAMDVHNAKLIAMVPGAQGLDFSHDGSRFATADGTSAYVWNTVDGHRIAGPLTLEERIDNVVHSPDGSLIVTHSVQGLAQVWNVSTGQSVSPVLRHKVISSEDAWAKYPSAAFSPDGKLLATAGLDETIRLWNVSDWLPHGQPLQHGGAVWGLAFRPDGKYLASQADDNTMRIWDVATTQLHGSPIESHCNDHGNPITFSPSGKWLLHKDAAQRTWTSSADSFEPHCRFDHGATLVLGAAFSPDEALLVTGSHDWTVRLWDTNSGQMRGKKMMHEGRVNTAAFSPRGNVIASGSSDSTVRMWNPKSQSRMGPAMYNDGPVYRIAFSPNGDYLATVGRYSTRVWKFGASLGVVTPIQDAQSTDSLVSVASLDGKYHVTISASGKVELENDSPQIAASDLTKYDELVRCVDISMDGTLLATGADDFSIGIWELSTGRLLKRLSAPDRTYGVAFSPADRLLLASAHLDGTVRLWNVGNGHPVGMPMRHEVHAWEVAFDSSGRMIAAITGREYLTPDRIYLWDIASEPPYQKIKLPFRPLKRRFLQSSHTGTLAAFDTIDELHIRMSDNGDQRSWRLPEAPADPFSMRRLTWRTIGMRRTLEETAEAIPLEEWIGLLHDERTEQDRK